MLQVPADENPPSRADYAAMVEDMDAGIGRILDALAARGLAGNTLVVFTSDNGGEWLSRNAPFFHRKDTVWEGGIRVPAIVRWPTVVPAGRTLSQVGVTMDLSADVRGGSRAATRPEPGSRASISCRSFAVPGRRSSGRSSGESAPHRVRRERSAAVTGSSCVGRVQSNSSST